MLLPLIAVIFEKSGVSSSLNGLNATALYIGILLVSPFMEMPLRKYGYKPVILIGGGIVVAALALFPVWQSFWFWFVLRLLIGIGDHSLHFATKPGLLLPHHSINVEETLPCTDYFSELALQLVH